MVSLALNVDRIMRCFDFTDFFSLVLQGTPGPRPTYTPTNNGNTVTGQPQQASHPHQQQTVKTPRAPMQTITPTYRAPQPWPPAQQAPAPQTYTTSLRYPPVTPYTAQQYTQHNSVSILANISANFLFIEEKNVVEDVAGLGDSSNL